MDNPETPATKGTIYRKKTNKAKNTIQTSRKISNTAPTKMKRV